MVIDESCRHWCQPDYATTCLVSALKQQAGQSAEALRSYLAQGMEQRSGLYFANPYLVDWVLAQALQHDPEAEDQRQQLRAEVLASMNPDYSFGRYDLAFSTALAIATLRLLGEHHRTVLAAQLRLLDFMQPEGCWPIAIPFYSSLCLDQKQFEKARFRQTLIGITQPSAMKGLPKQTQLQRVELSEEIQYHGISLYLDGHRMISTALATIALAKPAILPDAEGHQMLAGISAHPRYQCRNHCEYIAKFALPPYLQTRVASTLS